MLAGCHRAPCRACPLSGLACSPAEQTVDLPSRARPVCAHKYSEAPSSRPSAPPPGRRACKNSSGTPRCAHSCTKWAPLRAASENRMPAARRGGGREGGRACADEGSMGQSGVGAARGPRGKRAPLTASLTKENALPRPAPPLRRAASEPGTYSVHVKQYVWVGTALPRPAPHHCLPLFPQACRRAAQNPSRAFCQTARKRGVGGEKGGAVHVGCCVCVVWGGGGGGRSSGGTRPFLT